MDLPGHIEGVPLELQVIPGHLGFHQPLEQQARKGVTISGGRSDYHEAKRQRWGRTGIYVELRSLSGVGYLFVYLCLVININ
jgi:hypothetical protein